MVSCVRQFSKFYRVIPTQSKYIPDATLDTISLCMYVHVCVGVCVCMEQSRGDGERILNYYEAQY